jgi:lipoprotein-releasing system ATP-binding protein
MTNVLTFANVSKYFYQAGQKITALDNISLNIEQGEFIALLGPSGSGKTTLLQIAGLLDSIDSGKIIINNIDCSTSNDHQLTELRKKNIGFIYQFHHLLPEFSALENVAMPLLINGINKKTAYQQAMQMLSELDLADRFTHKPAQLSGGQQQRVAIARAIINKPKLVLADEPTGNLDNTLSEKIFILLQSITKNHGISCLLVTHNQELAKMADRTIYIKNGIIS